VWPALNEMLKFERELSSVFNGFGMVTVEHCDTRYGELTFIIGEMRHDMTFEQLFKLSELLGTVDINMRPNGEYWNISETTSDHVRMCTFICTGVDFSKLSIKGL